MRGQSFQEPTYRGIGPNPSLYGVRDITSGLARIKVDYKGKNGASQKSPTKRRGSSTTPQSPARRYEQYLFTKIREDNWKVADRVEISALQEKLKQTVNTVKKGSVIDAMEHMSAERRAQIDRLVDQKNLASHDPDVRWRCVYIDTPAPIIKLREGKQVKTYNEMDVIIAEHVSPRLRRRSPSHGRGKQFFGERSDINDPLRPTEKGTDKGGNRLDEQGPIIDHPPTPRFMEEATRQPAPSQGNPPAQPFPPNANLYGTPPDYPFYEHPVPPPAPNPPHGIQIIDDQFPAPKTVNSPLTPPYESVPWSQVNIHPHQAPLQPQKPPHLDTFNAANMPFRDPLEQPVILQDPQRDLRHHSKRWADDNSSRGSKDEFVFFDDDECSSVTSHSDCHPRLSMDRRESSTRRRHRDSNPLIDPHPSQLLDRHRDGRYHNGLRIEIIGDGRSRRRSSLGRRKESTRPERPQQSHQLPQSPPLTPEFNPIYSSHSSRRYPGHSALHDVNRDERRAEDHMYSIRSRNRERELDRRDFPQKNVAPGPHGGRGQGQYWDSR